MTGTRRNSDAVGGSARRPAEADAAWLGAVLESLVEATVVVHGDGRVEPMNDAESRIPGLPLDELVALDDTVPPTRLRCADGRLLAVHQRPAYRALREGMQQCRELVSFTDHERTRWLEVSARRLEHVGAAAASVSVWEVTARRESEQALAYRLEFEDLVTSISTRFVLLPPEEVRPGIDRTLRDIGAFLAAGRAYVFELDPVSQAYDETHEWCAAGVPSYREVRRGVSASSMPWWVERLSRGHDLVIRDVADLPGDADRERRIFRSQSVTALACVPMFTAGRLHGFIGVDVLDGPRAWDADTIRLLRVVGEMISGAIERSRAARRLARAAEDVMRNNAVLEQTNDELRRANRAKDEFLSVASHELRTPLTTILGFVETLRDHGDRLEEARRREFLEVLDRQSRRLYRLVDDLLETSRITAGRALAHPEGVEVGPVLTELLHEWREALGDVEPSGDHGAVAHVDPDHLRRMLSNLLENAAKYGEPPYAVAVTASDAEVAVSIRDHGPGVPPGFVPRLFDRFSQASTGTTRSASGTGLGLSIVRDLARLNGGRVAFAHAHPGARFTLELPRSRPVSPPDGT